MGSRRSRVDQHNAWAWSRRPDPGSDLRVSTAERSEVADTLSQHYAEGRLDAVEFNERIEQATSAKTRSDLSGLLTDLPAPDGSAPTSTRRNRRPLLLTVAVGAALAVAAVWTMSTPHIVWLFLAVFAWVVLRRRRRDADPGSPS